ncbi:MAG: hypothetical protein KIS81_08545 [Maricaulaceae bacterium]|nr:hypothetical protein [Maricaulaceae bacterium]
MRLSIFLVTAALVLSGCQNVRELGRRAPANPGPCPSALSLYDAHRIVNLHGGENFQNVGFTGEILNVRSLCRYYDDRPLVANLEIDMAFGRGPSAYGDTYVYNYFVAVTRRDSVVIHRETFPVQVRFRRGADRVYHRERIGTINIPRASDEISGENFEIIVGFELTDEQLAFNRSGRRFVVDAGRESRN